MSFKQSKLLNNKEEIEEKVYELLLGRQYYKAFQVAKEIDTQGTVFHLINLAVCLNASKSYSKALFYLEKAFSKIHTSTNMKSINLTVDDLNLIRAENEEKSYLQAINPKYELESFLLEMRIDFFRLDLYILCKKENNALEIINKYKEYNFKSITQAEKKL